VDNYVDRAGNPDQLFDLCEVNFVGCQVGATWG